MSKYLLYISFIFASVQGISAEPISHEPLVPPVLNLVTVNHSEASATLWWTSVSTPDLAGYVIYSFRNGEGYAIDTIRNPLISSYTDYSTPALFYSETYVVASLDFDDNVSPLSNPVSTIFLNAKIDTCNLKINLTWNSFNPPTTEVSSYEILISTGGPFTIAGTTSAGINEFTITDFDFYSTYACLVRAILGNGDSSLSNRAFVSTDMPRPPSWIEISNVTINSAGKVELDITYDPMSEITLFQLERMSETDPGFLVINSINSTGGHIMYSDPEADTTKRYLYRVAAINNCNVPSIISSEAGNLVVHGELDDFILNIKWNSYRGWPEGVNHYSLIIRTGDGIDQEIYIPASDTSYSFPYSDLMYDLPEGYICFHVKAQRDGALNDDIHSKSNTVCIETIENLFVPNAFSPDNNGVNDYWGPVISFTPTSYYLVIRSRGGGVVFEAKNHLQTWDGTHKGRKQLPDVYLWYLKIETPSGKQIEKNGTLLLIYNQENAN